MTTTLAGPAILSGSPQPLITDPTLSLLGEAERTNLLRVFDQCAERGGREADEVEEFENLFARKLGVECAITTCSATAGMQIAMQAYGIGEGDEVLVSPYTFAASGHAIVHAGAKPVFTDIDKETLCISPEAIEQRITPRTKAIMVVDIGGKPARMREILDIAEAHGLRVIEDAAQAHGATYEGQYAGTLGDAGVFSFSPKLMTSFRGGVIVTNDADTAEVCRRFRFHGLPGNRNRVRQQRQLEPVSQTHFHHHEAGYSLAMTPLQAALLIPQIESLDDRCAIRYRNAMRLAEGLAEIPAFTPVVGTKAGRSNFYMLEVLYDPTRFGNLTRDQLVAVLTWEGVPISPTATTKMLIYDNPSLRQFYDQPCPIAEDVLRQLIIFGHPLQSLAFQSDEARMDLILERIRLVYQHAEEIAAHYAQQESAQL
ncbi:MAG TPA: DegT/DnrJ/EryC1/StrS family aminotransferase [Pyrinomonadaceae bacterium]|nr:DegT/DnrJ/EryC1/StrS family aminotransferase [Pyrinomonadaceae bacterium]